MNLTIKVKSFSFHLNQKLKTSNGFLHKKEGWIIRISDSYNNFGWGEVSSFNKSELNLCRKFLKGVETNCSRLNFENSKAEWPGPLAFGIYSALAELDGLIGLKSKQNWLKAPKSAILIPDMKLSIKKLREFMQTSIASERNLTFKIKVGINSDQLEKEMLNYILEILPTNSHLRIDANGSWSREQAKSWINLLSEESRIEWIEQPIAAEDIEGLEELTKLMPIALDESLLKYPSLIKQWKGWQVRRPSLEGDPKDLLRELQKGKEYRSISTSFETGIGRRWINHFAALQLKGRTPVSPGLAPNWTPKGNLFSNNPELVWEAI